MQIADKKPNPFWDFMARISSAANLTESQREAMARAVDRYRGERFWVVPRKRPAEAQVDVAARCLASRMDRAEVVAALQKRFGICRTVAYERVRKALARGPLTFVDALAGPEDEAPPVGSSCRDMEAA
jgi:hypothetical protein